MAQSSAAPTTFQKQTRRPLQVRLLNWAGETFKLDRLSKLELSDTSLMQEAQRTTGLSDWGDEGFRIALQKLMAALNTEAHLNPVGRYLFRQECVRLLANRLRLQDDFKRHSDIFDVPVPRPLFVVGMFRSGTTLLHNLLSQDTSSRWLHVAEALIPTPSPRQDTWAEDPRLQEAAKFLQFQNSLAEGFKTAKNISADQPAECSRLFEHAFMGHLFDFKANVRSFSDWLYAQDQFDAYHYYRQQLQYLGYHWPGGHWCLKAPAHIFALDALLDAFPDASIVYIHRDPVVVLPSCCSLASLGRARYSDDVDPKAIGAFWLDRLADGVERAMRVRDQADANRFCEVHYHNLVEAPVRTIGQIYEHFDYTFTDQMKANMQAWRDRNPQHQYGVHRYELDQFGLAPEAINQRFANYRQRFDIRSENEN